MLETSGSHKGSRTKNKVNSIRIETPKTNKELIEKDKEMINRKGTGKKKNKTMKRLKKLEFDSLKENKKTKFSLGEIEIAKIHREATRPLKQIKDLTKKEIKKNSCPCCGLPTKISGKLENYKLCNSPDELSNCGEGVVLYFSFFKFCIIITFIAVMGISCLDSYISYNCYYELTKFCQNLDLHEKNPYHIIHKCEVYSPALRMRPESKHKETNLYNSFFFKISLVNFRNYKYISENLNNNDKFESTIINLNYVNFLCLINIFIAYASYIFFIYNKSKAINYSDYTVGDYTIFLTNLNDIFRKFEKDLEYIQNKENESYNSYQKLDFKLYEEKLGFEPDKNMPKLNLFKKFLEKKLFKNYNINSIVLCYQLNEIMSLEKNIEELNEKIERIEFDQSMIKKNKGIKGDKRIYYSCLCCKETLEQIKKKKKDKEKYLNELIEASKENTLENFCGAAFAIFNSIKEKEDYLNQNNKNCCYRLLEALITLIKVYYYFSIPFIIYSFGCCCCCNCCQCCCCCCTDEEEDPLNSYKRKIRFERAPEPEDIIFENLEISFKAKLKNIIYISFASLIILLISNFIYGLLYNYQAKIDNLNDKTIILYVLSLLITIITAIFDLIFEIVLEKIVKFEKSNTLTNFYATYSIQLTFFYLNNSLIIYYSEEHEITTSNLIIKFLFNSFVTPIMWTINFKYVYKKIKQCIIEQKETINYNQKELNELYELQSMNVPAKYSYLVKTLFMSFIYFPIFPLGFCISLIGFIFGYWWEKFNFSIMYKKPEKLDKQITEYYVIFFFLNFLIFAFGSFYFLSVGHEVDIFILVIFIVNYILLIIPFHLCFQKDYFKFNESEIHKKTYDDMYLNFIIDYERANPMTRIEGEMRYLDKLEEKNKITKKEKDKRKKKIKEENQIKTHLRQQRLSRIINIKELNNILTLDDDDKQENNIILNMEQKKNKININKNKCKSLKKTQKK